MPWQLIIIAFIFLTSLRAIVTRQVGLNKQDLSVYTLVVSYVSVLSVGVTITLINFNKIDLSLVPSNLHRLILGGIAFGLINLIVIKLFRYLPASIVVFIGLLNTVSVVAVASIFSGENLTMNQWYGAVFLGLAVVLITFLATKNQKNNKNNKYHLLSIFLAIIVALLFGPAIVNEKYLIDTIGLETYLLFGWGFQALAAFVIAFILRNKNKKKIKISSQMQKNIWTYGFLLGLSGLLFVISLKSSGSSSLTTISSTARIAVTVFMAYFILGEKDHLKLKLTGLMLSSIGLFLLFS